MAVRVFHGDDNALFRRLVRELLPEGDDIEMVGDAAGPDEVVDGVAAVRPDVVLLDQLGGADLVARVRAACPGVRVVVLSGHQPGDGDPTIAAAADDYVVKAADFAAVRAAVLEGA